MQETKEKRTEARNKYNLVDDISKFSHILLFDILNTFFAMVFSVAHLRFWICFYSKNS